MRNFWAGSKRDWANPRKNSERKLRACETFKGKNEHAFNEHDQTSRCDRIHLALASWDTNSDFAFDLLAARLHIICRGNTGVKFMLWTIFVILLILWLLGFLGHVGGGLIHLLLVIAVIVLVINLIQGRRPL